MANQFLVEIHDFISRQLDAAKHDMDDAKSRGDDHRKVFVEGKINEFKRFRSYLNEHFNLTTQKYY